MKLASYYILFFFYYYYCLGSFNTNYIIFRNVEIFKDYYSFSNNNKFGGEEKEPLNSR
jgi:hypothetical protein